MYYIYIYIYIYVLYIIYMYYIYIYIYICVYITYIIIHKYHVGSYRFETSNGYEFQGNMIHVKAVAQLAQKTDLSQGNRTTSISQMPNRLMCASG